MKNPMTAATPARVMPISRSPVLALVRLALPYGLFTTSGHVRNQSIALVFFTANQDFALSGMVGLADDAFLFHALHQRGGPVVADLQAALDVARRGLAVARHHLDGLLIKVGAVRFAAHGGG